MIFRILVMSLFCFSLSANAEQKDEKVYMQEATAYFFNEEYKDAFEIYTLCVEKYDNSKAAYQIGWMYENGKGAQKDAALAIKWYKKAAKLELANSNKEAIYETLYRNLDPIEDKDSADTLIQLNQGKFGLRAYYPNYAVVSYTDKIPKGEQKYEEGSQSNPNDTKYIHTEEKYQISLRADYLTQWFGFTQMWTGAYTQTSYWQILIDSAPFRETNYKPELFVSIPFYHKADVIGLKGISFGYKHSSNGQSVTDSNRTRPTGPMENSRSRSWNRLYARAYFQWSNFFSEFTLWHRMSEPLETDDNPDILDYYGRGSIEIGHVSKKLLTRLTIHPSFAKKHVSVELEMSYPVPISNNVFFYLQAFSGIDSEGNYGGYGQSLIDYDQQVNQIGFGLSISR